MTQERLCFTKFGNAKGLPAGPDLDSTNFGDSVYLKLTFPHLAKKEQIVASKKVEITCRNCKGNHWTTACPYKDQVGSLSYDAASSSAPAVAYVPPSMRNKGEAGAKDADDTVIRISNLSEDSVEQDVRELVARCGEVSRVFVAKDRDTYVCKGYAFVTFLDRDDAQKAINKLNGHGYGSLILKVEWSLRDPAKV